MYAGEGREREKKFNNIYPYEKLYEPHLRDYSKASLHIHIEERLIIRFSSAYIIYNGIRNDSSRIMCEQILYFRLYVLHMVNTYLKFKFVTLGTH